ncbi:Dopamine N-acetyltransferase [Blattella germanica]|nr:Dopamine N-acetyltransferase [Blattella germanica]
MGDFEGIEFGLIPEERYDEVIHHLRHNFFADEPLNHAVALCRPGEPHAELEEHSLTTLRDGLSQMAVDTSSGEAKLQTLSDMKFRRIFDLLYGVNGDLDLFAQHGVDRIFECRILSVDKRYRGRGLARELLRRSEETARNAGFKVLKEDATGLFSQRVAESLGLQTVRQVHYADYTSADTGEVLFRPQSPHESLKIMVKLLQ